MKIHRRLLFLQALLLIASAGCGREESKGPAASGAAGRRTVVSNAGAYTVAFETSPDPVPMNAPFTVSFTVSAKDAKESAAEVQIDARMPAHGHGMNVAPKLTRGADGAYRAEGLLFHMPGHWELYFDMTRGGRSERAQADIHLK